MASALAYGGYTATREYIIRNSTKHQFQPASTSFLQALEAIQALYLKKRIQLFEENVSRKKEFIKEIKQDWGVFANANDVSEITSDIDMMLKKVKVSISLFELNKGKEIKYLGNTESVFHICLIANSEEK